VPATCPVALLQLAATALIATACATTVPSAQFGGHTSLRSPHLLTAAEISRVQVNSAYEAVQALRPNFLLGMRGRSVRAVYLNGVRLLGGMENLRMIEASTVRQIVFLSGIDATTRYGSGNGAGVLMVNTLPGQGW
jgi:hypothetical protein